MLLAVLLVALTAGSSGGAAPAGAPGVPGAPAVRAGEPTRATIPGTEVAITIELPDFEAETPDDPDRALLLGKLADGVTVSVLYEQNFPYLPGSASVARRSKESRFKAFQAGGVDCCEYTVALQSPSKKAKLDVEHYHAFPATPDFLFEIHVSVTRLGRGKHAVAYEREQFQRLVQTFAVTGRLDASAGELPPEAYAFRDEAAGASGDAVAWCEQRCAERAGEWAVHYYLGALAYEREDADRMLTGYGRAAELLGALAERSPKHVLALARACDASAGACFMRKKYAEAVPWLERLLGATDGDDSEAVRRLRPGAQLNLAGCYAKTNRADAAMESLRAALAADPDLKQYAVESELLAPLRSRKDFKELVGS